MSHEEKIVPITRGRGKPNSASFAVIAGATRVDVNIQPAQPVPSQPAAVVLLVRPEQRKDATPDAPVSNQILNHSKESKS